MNLKKGGIWPWICGTWEAQYPNPRHQSPTTVRRIPQFYPPSKVRYLNNQDTFPNTLIWVSMKICSTGVVDRFAYFDMNSRYSRWEEAFELESRGTSSGGPRSTRRAQKLSHICFPVTVEPLTSIPEVWLSNSFPIRSACFWKNRWSTITSVSSEVVPVQLSLISSGAPAYFWKGVPLGTLFQMNNCTLTCSSDRKRVTFVMFDSRNLFRRIMCGSLPKNTLLARFWMILAITLRPRRMTRVFSFFGTSISTTSGDTTTGEMNLRSFSRF